MLTIMNKEVFVKHEEAPTVPKLEGEWFFVDFKYIFYETRFFTNLTTSGRVLLIEMVKRHIYGPRPFISAYNQVSVTFCAKVPARTSSSLEKPLFFAIFCYFCQFDHFRSGIFDRNGQKAHLRTKTFHLSL